MLSSNNERSKMLISLLKTEKISVTVSNKIDPLPDQISSPDVQMILVNYQSIIGAQKKELASLFQNAQSTKFVVYDVPDDATRRKAFYRLGAYRVLKATYSMEDVSTFTGNTLQKIKSNGNLKESHFSGSLQDFNLAGLISIFGREKRSGILRIRTQHSMGKIYFSEGNIIQAVSGNLRSDDAVFYMLTWNNGWFSMRPLPLKPMKSHVQLSNIGMILYGEQVGIKIMNYLNDLGGINRQVRIINQGDIIQVKKDTILLDFVKYLQQFRKIHEIIEFSPYALLQTLELLIRFRTSENLEFRETVTGIGEVIVENMQVKIPATEQILTDSEVNKMRHILNAENISGGKLLVLGSRTCGKTDFIHNFNQANKDGVRTNQDLDYSRIDITHDFHLQVFGIVLDKMLMKIVEKLSEGLLGYVFLIDANKPDEFEYASYLINYLTGIFKVPWTVAVTNIDVRNSDLLRKIKSDIRLPDNRKLVICDVTDKNDVKKTIFSITR